MRRYAFGIVSLGVMLTGLISVPRLETMPAAAADDSSGWIQLFNGKDLTGWEVYPSGTGNWKVKDGILIGSGRASHLFTKRDDYTDFDYLVEAKINDHGNSGQYFRTKFGPGFPKGYEAQINSTHRDPVRTGSLYNFAPVYDMLVPPDTWFTQEVIARGNHIIIKVNGKTSVDFIDKNNTYRAGRFALQQHDPGTVVQFRKIEVKELK
jgi:3-keto-disaccharide hydrolase